jgi:hypothetical protein
MCLRCVLPAVFGILTLNSAKATLLWEANTANGTSVFEGLNIDEPGGTITVASDPLGQFGNVYKYYLPDETNGFGKERTESSGTDTNGVAFRLSYNTDYYIGWRAMWNPMPINPGWVALMQMHGYGVTGQGAPLVLRAVNGDGNLYLQNNANGVDTNFWHTTFHADVWQGFVLHVFLSTNPAVGYTELWYNGVQQTFNNGQTRWYGPTWDNVDGSWQDSYNKLKWGVYRSGAMDGKGPATAYMSEAKVGTTYADVDPGIGSPDFSISDSPSSQGVDDGKNTTYTTTISAKNGFGGNVSLSVSGLPTGASGNFNPASIAGSGNSTLTVTTSTSTPAGTYTLTVTGTSGSLQHSDTVTLTVSDFSISATPSSQTVTAGNGTSYTANIGNINGFTGSVSLSASGLPSGASASFNPTSVTAPGSSTMNVTTSTATPTGTDTLTITGTSGSLTHSTTVSLTVNPAVNFTGIYQLQNEASSLVLNNQGSLTNGSPITQWTIVSSSNLDWTFIATSNGYYQINSSKSGKDAVVQSASTSPGAGIIQWSFGSSGDDQWKPVQNSDGSYTFYNLHSGLVLGDPGSSTNKTTQMDQETANGGSNQKWNLLKQ